jgi:DNA-binding response OmpR family regulator
MKRWIKRSLFALFGVTVLVTGLSACGHRNHGAAAQRRPGADAPGAAARRFDAAILDVMLPEMDGFALCRTIRKESDIPMRDAHRPR